MLAEIAAANAAFGVLKTALSNGRDLYECGNVAKKYFCHLGSKLMNNDQRFNETGFSFIS